ncbi:YlbD family protein [Niallia sp. Krafla_26]|uniref:YlbD family protein n=1 Tax=Niallia sp. Krafla_26 TaxID=3064703 RepID=UPI003D163489
MSNQKIHPSVEEFKKFVTKHPKILDEVRNGDATLQELYEDWYLLGEDDPRWENLLSEQRADQTENAKTDWTSSILESMKKMDPAQIQHYIGHISQALQTVQGVLAQFQSGNQKPSATPQEKPNNPFFFRKD